jgi:hypothetical protein
MTNETVKPSARQTVAALRAQLIDLPNDMPVIISRDAEGNGFHLIATDGISINKATTFLDNRWPTIDLGESCDDDDPEAALIIWPDD